MIKSDEFWGSAMPDSGWRTRPLGEVVNLKRGYDLPDRVRNDGPFPVVSSSGRTGAHNEAKVEPPGVVTGRYGTLGKVYFIEEPFWPLNTTLYVQDFKGNDPRFVSYLLESLDLAGLVASAAVPGINRNHLHPLSVTVPDPPLQTKLARALAAFDELIANNRRRVEILEEMARLIYGEWFVHFRYPGHEEAVFVDSKLGTIPEGWDARPIGDVIETVGGGTPSKEKPEYWAEASIEWYTPSDLTRRSAMFALGSSDQINELGLSKSSAKLFPPRTVMITSRATIGEIAIATTEASTNQGFISCVPNERLSEYHLYFWLQENVDLFHTLAGGATFKELRKSTFRSLPIAVPPAPLETQFNEVVGPMCALVENLLRQNQVLQRARDLLLPRLISGELDVSGLDLDLEPVA